MTAPLVLQVPAPTLRYEPPGGSAPLEQAVGVEFADVQFPDGTGLTAADYKSAVAVLGRVRSAAAAPEVWDATSKTWRALAGSDLSQMGGIPLIPPKSGTALWKGLLVGAAVQDAGGAPQIQAAAARFPQYTLRGAFVAQRGATTGQGVGPESAPVEFSAAVKLLEVDSSSGTPVITLVNRDGGGAPMARVRLEADGGITLLPLPGRRVVIQGDLEVDHVHYLPAAGGAKVDL